jgi:hypothetical protein
VSLLHFAYFPLDAYDKAQDHTNQGYNLNYKANMERDLRQAIDEARRVPYTITLLTNYLEADAVETAVATCGTGGTLAGTRAPSSKVLKGGPSRAKATSSPNSAAAASSPQSCSGNVHPASPSSPSSCPSVMGPPSAPAIISCKIEGALDSGPVTRGKLRRSIDGVKEEETVGKRITRASARAWEEREGKEKKKKATPKKTVVRKYVILVPCFFLFSLFPLPFLFPSLIFLFLITVSDTLNACMMSLEGRLFLLLPATRSLTLSLGQQKSVLFGKT